MVTPVCVAVLFHDITIFIINHLFFLSCYYGNWNTFVPIENNKVKHPSRFLLLGWLVDENLYLLESIVGTVWYMNC